MEEARVIMAEPPDRKIPPGPSREIDVSLPLKYGVKSDLGRPPQFPRARPDERIPTDSGCGAENLFHGIGIGSDNVGKKGSPTRERRQFGREAEGGKYQEAEKGTVTAQVRRKLDRFGEVFIKRLGIGLGLRKVGQ